MIQTLKELSWALTKWRGQVFSLAVNVLRKNTHDSALGWFWLFAKPAMYIFCFWFALSIGLRAARISGLDDMTYMFWLASGLIPWFYLQTMLGSGTTVFKKYSYLVNKLKFPVPLISVFHQLGNLFTHLMLLVVLMAAYFIAGNPLDIYALQLPLLVVLMYLFSVGFSLLMSTLTSFSSDIKQLLKAFSTPIFWLSGILFPVASLAKFTVIKWILYFNPITFIVNGYRMVFVNDAAFKGWIWDSPEFFVCGIAVIAFTILLGLIMYSRLKKDVPDVI